MKLRSVLNLFLMCAMMGCLLVPAGALGVPNEHVVQLESLAWEWVDADAVEPWEEGPELLTTGSINKSITGHSIYTMSQKLYLQAGDSVTINCSYSPSPASVDFGLLTSDNKFYSINVKGGSIDQTFEISQSGSYTVAIRNDRLQNNL